MKYSKKTLSVLISDVRALVDQAFRFQLTQKELLESYSNFLDSNLKTETGKKRYPDYYSIALSAFFNEFSQVRQDEELLWCYVIDGTIYHGMKKCLNAYKFKGDTSIPNYRDLPDIEAKILNPHNSIERGFFYPSGKVYFKSK